jgi:hypothetical protein
MEKAACPVLFGVPFDTSKTYRSLALAVSSSTSNKPSEFIIFEIPPFSITRLQLNASAFTQLPKRSGSKPGLLVG